MVAQRVYRPMAKEKIVVGLDIGSANVKIAVGILKNDAERPEILGVKAVPSSGVRKGVVVEIKEVVASTAKAIEMVETVAGVTVASVVASVNGTHVNMRKTKGVVVVSRADSEISEGDVERALDAAKTISLPANREIITVIPLVYNVDGEMGIKDPVGMNGVKLEAEAVLIDALSPAIKNLRKCINETRLDIDALIPAGLAAAQSLLNKKQLDLGTAVVDVGAGTTSIAVYEEGKLIHFKVFPVGGAHITNDIAIGLRTSTEVAEEVKLRYGNALPANVNKKDVINMAEFGADLNFKIAATQLTEIIEARVSEIFELLNKELKSIDRKGLLPGGIVFAGGGIKIPGTVELAKEIFKLPAQIGATQNVSGVLDEMHDPIYAACLGLVKEGLGNGEEQAVTPSRRGIAVPNIKIKHGFDIRKFIKSFIP